MNPSASAWLSDIAGAWSCWMFGMAWIVAVLVGVLALVTSLLKRRSAGLLYALWLIVLVRLVLPPDFAFPTGWGWWIRGAPSVASFSDESPVSVPVPAVEPVGESLPVPKATEIAPATSSTIPYRVILMIAWVGIVAARCGMLLTVWLQVHVWVSRAHLILDPELLALMEECRERVGVRRRVELRNSEACSTPLVVGVWRPVLLLPAAVLERLSLEQLRSVLIHELHHVRRWDGLVNLAQGLLGAIYFFHPAVWWANRRIRQLREDACDERTVAVMEGNRKPYGEAIFRVAEILGYSAPPLTLGVLDSTSPLADRLRRILDPRLPLETGRNWQSALILIITMAILLPAGARPPVSVAEGPTDRRIVAEAFADSPVNAIRENRLPRPRDASSDPEQEFAPELTEPESEFKSESPESGSAVSEPGAMEPSPVRPPSEPTEPQPTPAEGVVEPEKLSHQAPAAINELVGDLSAPRRRAAAVETLLALGSEVEPALLAALRGADRATREAIYDILMQVGTSRSLVPLHHQLLVRNELEERRVRQALDVIYRRLELPAIRVEPTPNSTRVYEPEEEDEWDDGF